MAQISLECPHCLTERAGFSGSQYLHFRPGTNVFILFLQCGVCGEGVIGKYSGSNFTGWAGGREVGDTKLIEMWPKKPAVDAPEHVPDNVRSFYLQGMDNLKRRNWDASGTMFRKSLDTALKRLDPTGKGTLQNRIDNLPVALGITAPMREWAHQIRDLGNDAAHEEEPFTEDETKALQALALQMTDPLLVHSIAGGVHRAS